METLPKDMVGLDILTSHPVGWIKSTRNILDKKLKQHR